MKRPETAPTSTALPLEWFALGIEFLASKGIDEETYRNRVIKDRLLNSIATVFWSSLLEHAHTIGMTIDDVGKVLGVNRSNISRWLRGETRPNANKFFVTIVALDLDIKGIAFPQRDAVVWQAVARTIERIRTEECGLGKRTLTKEDLLCTRDFLRHPESIGLAPGSTAVESPDLGRILSAVAHRVRQHSSETQNTDADAVQRAVAEWIRPYVLFRVGLLGTWEFFDEDST